LATGKANPLASEETGSGPTRSGREPKRPLEFDLAIDPAQVIRLSSPRPWRLRHLMYVVAIVAVLVWVIVLVRESQALIALLAMGGLLLLFVSAMGMGVVLAWRAATRQDTLLQILAIAAEGEMPLAPAVAAFADQYRGTAHRRMMTLAARLNWGTRLAEALEIARGLVTRDAVLLVWIGEAAGLLPKALRTAATSRSSQLPIWTSIASRLSYILILMLSMQGICGFVLYFFVPKLEAIAADFKLALPQITVLVIQASQFLMRYGAPVVLLPVFELALLIFLPFSFLGWGSYSVPFFDRLLGRRHTALVLRSLSLMVEAGKPVSVALQILKSHYPAYWIRRRLAHAEFDVRQGVEWIQALWRQRLIGHADADVLAAAEAVGNLAWALSELATALERRMTIRFQIAIQALFPLVVLMLGMVVFILVAAYFLPLVDIIKSLS
jgi:type II secretory pathway component PulF